MATSPPRPRSFVTFGEAPPGTGRRALAQAERFAVEWFAFDGIDDAQPCGWASDTEALVIVAAGPVQIDGATAVPAESVAIVPAGTHRLRAGAGARCALVTSQRGDREAPPARNAADYAGREPAPPTLPAARRQPLPAPQVLAFADIRASAAKPRLKMLQTATLSINIVDYTGPRDRAALSPHSHADFEQGSLALYGDFVHHLRTPWGSDANAWRDDEHLSAPSPSLVVIPTEVVHTTEGVGEGRHLLIDVFSPPRADFIAEGWVFNAADYRAPAA